MLSDFMRFTEKEVDEKIIKEIIKSCDAHMKKYGFRTISTKDLDRLCSTP